MNKMNLHVRNETWDWVKYGDMRGETETSSQNHI